MPETMGVNVVTTEDIKSCLFNGNTVTMQHVLLLQFYYACNVYQPVTILSTFKATAPLSKACRLNTPQNVPTCTCKTYTNDNAELIAY